jgi:endonuclease III
MAQDASTLNRLPLPNRAVFSGQIWEETVASRSQIVRRVCEKLLLSYGRPRLGNPDDPVDDLVFIMLSNKTSPEVAVRVYHSLKREYPSWEKLARAPLGEIRRVLHPAGLSRVKSRQLRAALRRLKTDFGTCTLNELIGASQFQVEGYLTSLSGISGKVAKCVMLYTMGFDVLPVDAHVHRVTTRLGWTARKRADQCHEELEALVRPKYRYALHVNCVEHGRQICRPINPKCDECIIRRWCFYPKESDEKTTKANRH